MGKRLVIGVDFGGSASKATLLDETGVVVAAATQNTPLITPNRDG